MKYAFNFGWVFYVQPLEFYLHSITRIKLYLWTVWLAECTFIIMFALTKQMIKGYSKL